jgi:transcriptional regulator with PAS, ATPase and Fis domain
MVNPKTQNTIKTITREGQQIEQKRFHLIQTNVVGWVMKHQQSFHSNSISTDIKFKDKNIKQSGVRAVLCSPLLNQTAQIGYLLLMNLSKNNIFSSDDIKMLEKSCLVLSPYLSDVQNLQEFFMSSFSEETLTNKYKALGLLGRSDRFIGLLKAIEAAARCNVRVILEGESGTGKELIARAIHQISSRQPFPFIAVDCGAIPENLLESELFGHCKGAFTGAHANRKGLIEEAEKGTLFLDEITNLDLEMQSKLLRVLQENEIRPLGSNKPKKVDVRLITASSLPLTELVKQKKFREDLFYRLHVYPIPVPTLNEREQDIPLIANHLLNKFSAEQNKKVNTFHPSIILFLRHRKWMGNIRELENFIERLVTIASTDQTEINEKLLPVEFKKDYKNLISKNTWHPLNKSLQDSLKEQEEELIRQALEASDWNLSKAARILDISKSNIRYRMDKLNISKLD